jgi:hypothetical protein
MLREASLRAWLPAIHAGMTKIPVSVLVDERTIMNHFVAKIFSVQR